eukprot:5021143-Amphidinium_carterae.1
MVVARGRATHVPESMPHQLAPNLHSFATSPGRRVERRCGRVHTVHVQLHPEFRVPNLALVYCGRAGAYLGNWQ